MKLVLIRHPRPIIEPGICYGQTDIPCILPTEEKLQASLQNLERLLGSKHGDEKARPTMYSSPLQRCKIYADILAKQIGTLSSVILDDRLKELDFGAWEMKNWNDVERTRLDQWAEQPLHFAAPGGESFSQLIGRSQTFLEEIKERHSAQENLIMVGHGGVIKAFSHLLRGTEINDCLNLSSTFEEQVLFTL